MTRLFSEKSHDSAGSRVDSREAKAAKAQQVPHIPWSRMGESLLPPTAVRRSKEAGVPPPSACLVAGAA